MAVFNIPLRAPAGKYDIALQDVSASRVFYWNGSQWVSASTKYWSGSQWVAAEVKVWDGGQFIL